MPDEFWKWIRYHPAMFFGAADRELPCVVLPMRAFDNPRSLRGVHLIALANDALNYKHDGHSLKISRGLLLGRAAVMTAPAGPDLCLCEGFETALGILMLGKNDGAPVWATTGREFLAAVPPLPDVTGKLIICADNDTSRDGLASARKLRRVWLKDSEADEVRLLWPSREGTDYADEATTKTDGRKPCPKKSQNESVWPTN